MEAFNLFLFDAINAGPYSPEWLLLIGHFFAVYAIFLVPILLVIGWVRRDEHQHRAMLCAMIGCCVALAINGVIGALWYHPRPFVMPVGHTFLHHSPDASFPSDHMTIVMTVAFSMMYSRETRLMGNVLAVLGLLIAWSRIYMGVHFPLDMAGGLIVALFSSSVAYFTRRLYMAPLYHIARGIYRRLFAQLIKRGWISR